MIMAAYVVFQELGGSSNQLKPLMLQLILYKCPMDTFVMPEDQKLHPQSTPMPPFSKKS
jgi:hypothetical protein